MRNPIVRSTLILAMLATASMANAQRTPGDYIDDPAITARVKYALFDILGSTANDINVETAKGVVQLAGWVDSDEEKASAGRVAGDTKGVVAVSNRLLVSKGSRTAGQVLDDSLLAAKVKLALAESEETSAMSVNVEVRESDVELSGFVDTYAERDAAIDLVESIDGVKGVINSIDLTPRE